VTNSTVDCPFGSTVDFQATDRRRVGWLTGFSGRGTTRAEDAQGTPSQSHISPSILVYEEYLTVDFQALIFGSTVDFQATQPQIIKEDKGENLY